MTKAEANRENASRSTGPRSPEGKAVSSKNATKHGLRATRDPLAPGEEPLDPVALAALCAELEPGGEAMDPAALAAVLASLEEPHMTRADRNRQNAAASTGPRTPEGKAASSRNATTHGLLSGKALLPGEEWEDLLAFEANLCAELGPVGELEQLLVDRIISNAWRLRRVLAVEGGLFVPPERHSWEREWTPAEALANRFELASRCSDSFSKLSRYETAIERSLFHALHELERRQAARAGKPVPLPAALDVTVDAGGFVSQTGDGE